MPLSVGACEGGSLVLGRGPHELRATAGLDTGFDVDRVILRSGGAAGNTTVRRADVPIRVLERSRTTRRIEVGPCPDGCWLVTGDGWNTGWAAMSRGLARSARAGRRRLQRLVAPAEGTGSVIVEADWTPQRRIWSGLGLLGAGARRLRSHWWRSPIDVGRPWRRSRVRSWSTHDGESGPVSWLPVLVAAGLGTLAIGPTWGAIAAAAALVATVLRRPALLGLAGSASSPSSAATTCVINATAVSCPASDGS